MTKLQDAQESVEELKNLAELLYSAPESALLDKYEKFLYFKNKLNSLLSTMARYRIQLNASEDEALFGPKTLKTVESLVFNYDKLYEIYEEHLFNVFTPLEPLYLEMLTSAKPEETDQGDKLKSINEETKFHLEQIETNKRLQETKAFSHKVDFDKIANEELVYCLTEFIRAVLNDLFNKILTIFKEDPCNDLEKILLDLYEAHEEHFVQILENVSNLLREISRKPDELGLRILRINNERLQKDFLEHVNSVKLLKFAGFRISTTSDLKEHLSKLNAKFDEEYFLYLHEPDMFAFYNKWKDWLNNINNVSRDLRNFLSNYKLLKRTDDDIKSVISKSLS